MSDYEYLISDYCQIKFYWLQKINGHIQQSHPFNAGEFFTIRRPAFAQQQKTLSWV